MESEGLEATALQPPTPSAWNASPGLLPLLDAPRRDPVWSMAEGVIWPDARARLRSDRLGQYDRLLLAGFLGDTKVSYDAARRRIVRQTLFGAEVPATAPAVPEGEMARGMIDFMDRIGESIRRELEGGMSSSLATVESWGYA